MKKFVNIYEFNVFDEISKGEEVYCVDKLRELFDKVIVVNAMDVCGYADLHEKARKDKTGRFVFWKVIENEENEVN